MEKHRRMLFIALTMALALMLASGILSTMAGSSNGELIKNGDFEQGFRLVDGCGMVGVDWGCFNTGGAGGYGFYDDAWGPVVATGAHAQLIEINTKEIGGDQNRTAGIYQTVDVIPGETYILSFNGMMRANDFADGGDPWRYVMLVGFTHNGSANWADAQVQEVDVGPIQDRLNPTQYYHVQLNVTALSDKLTVFIAGRMKWGDWYKEVDFDVDTVSLQGPKPSAAPTPTGTPSSEPTPAPTSTPAPGELVCDGPNLLQNGGFEGRFDADGTAAKWGKFNNGGRAAYGWYREAWAPVVAEGAKAQLLEINTFGFMPADPDRWIGIHQRVSGLNPGGVYQLSLKAMIRELADHSDEDPWRYEVYWGLNRDAGKIARVGDLEMLHGIPVSGIYLRTAPGPYSSFSTTFQAPTSEIRLYLLGLMKWAKSDREVNFDFDAIELRACRTAPADPSPADPPDGSGSAASVGEGSSEVVQAPAAICTYIVQPGDYISRIADQFGVSVDWLVTHNDLPNPNLLFVGQPLRVPCSVNAASPPAPEERAQVRAGTPSDGAGSPTEEERVTQEEDQRERDSSGTEQEEHTVVRGESLSQIAFRYGTTVQELRRINHIENPRLIRPGQVLQLPTH
ncbi:MAG TPA: LysM peptidoglycan-binding domain-containing protein [Caldilineales bacterium]|nr:LysM peptidoglycan-binding domain-containing protein [Caldilineales bacterium]